MSNQRQVRHQRQRRVWRSRKAVRGSTERPRLAVFRSHKHIYAQVINDETGTTLAAASTADSDVASAVKYGGNKTAAAAVGKAIASKALSAGVKQVAFDRRGYKYHGRVAALATAAREAGLSF